MAVRKRNASPEKRIEYEILGFLRSVGFFCYKNDTQGTYDPIKKTFRTNKNPYKIKGISDIHAFMFKRFIAIEVKSEKGKLTDEQRKYLVEINNNGQIGFVARSLPQFLEEIIKHFPDQPDFQQLIKKYLQAHYSVH